MKKIITFLLCLILSLSTLPLFAFADDEYFSQEQIDYYKNLGLQGTTVNVYNWGEYISDGSEGSIDVVKEFEKLTGCKVNYTNFESNENMYSKLTGGGVSYDVIVPSDYMIDKLIDEDMLLELDYNNIPNIKYVDKKFQNLFFDPDQKYTVCYNVGTTILIYNKKLVKEKPTSWDVLWDEQYKGKVLMFNNPRDAFAIAIFNGEGLESPTIGGAKAANQLLDISGIKASFVITEYNEKIYISARSIDEVNVQLVMEKLGGGGHMSIAGAQLTGCTVKEAVDTIKETLDNMLAEGEI